MICIPTAPRSVLALSCAAALLAGCASERRQPLPAVNLPAQWTTYDAAGTAPASAASSASAPFATSPIPADWWRGFGDPVLDRLIADALDVNNDLAAATIRVYRARLQAGLVATNQTPNVTLEGAGSVSHSLGGNDGMSRNFDENGSVPRTLDSHRTSRMSNLSGMLSYELDLWGKLAALRDAARWSANATQANRDAARLSLIGTTAALYWEIGYLNQQIALGDASITYAERTLALVRARHAAGAVSGFDVAQAELSVSAQRAAQTHLIQQRTVKRHALAILFDRPPQAKAAEPTALPDRPLPAVPAGVPADLLGRRPDLREAEFRLRESLANLDFTRTSFYPSFTLTSSFGTSSASLERVLSNPIAMLGLGLSLPLIEWNTMRLKIKVSQTEYEEAVVAFRQRLHTALGEVENVLSARAQLEREGEQHTLSLKWAQHAEALARVRFVTGATDVRPWLDQQQRLRDAQSAVALNRLHRLNNRMDLYKALGGSDH
ncbi:efflux transporter outer membrane subunit [Burkholderia sp. IMCC1007]|uniref:efflux transporter outer membrane subunit n=1 Tax=Burkholderia sp. IMCC1007 TaxID=3004104 RepID=UPI0022B57A09|nr:efflux transporter outer membrane subunit [Burkholderia sp. IMCC1007]